MQKRAFQKVHQLGKHQAAADQSWPRRKIEVLHCGASVISHNNEGVARNSSWCGKQKCRWHCFPLFSSPQKKTLMHFVLRIQMLHQSDTVSNIPSVNYLFALKWCSFIIIEIQCCTKFFTNRIYVRSNLNWLTHRRYISTPHNIILRRTRIKNVTHYRDH